MCVFVFMPLIYVCVLLFAGKNIYNGEHVAIKLVSAYFMASAPVLFSFKVIFFFHHMKKHLAALSLCVTSPCAYLCQCLTVSVYNVHWISWFEWQPVVGRGAARVFFCFECDTKVGLR